MLNAIDTARGGINAGFDRLDRAAGRIARDGADGDLARNTVDQMQSAHEVRANIAVVRTADEMIASLLDVLA